VAAQRAGDTADPSLAASGALADTNDLQAAHEEVFAGELWDSGADEPAGSVEPALADDPLALDLAADVADDVFSDL
jgi:hypothetical protein